MTFRVPSFLYMYGRKNLWVDFVLFFVCPLVMYFYAGSFDWVRFEIHGVAQGFLPNASELVYGISSGTIKASIFAITCLLPLQNLIAYMLYHSNLKQILLISLTKSNHKSIFYVGSVLTQAVASTIFESSSIILLYILHTNHDVYGLDQLAFALFLILIYQIMYISLLSSFEQFVTHPYTLYIIWIVYTFCLFVLYIAQTVSWNFTHVGILFALASPYNLDAYSSSILTFCIISILSHLGLWLIVAIQELRT